MAKTKNVVNQRQFRGGYTPDQPVDEFDRSYRKEASPPAQRKRNSVQLGSQGQARPGLAGMQDYKRKAR